MHGHLRGREGEGGGARSSHPSVCPTPSRHHPQAWKAALKASDFSKFAPFLKQRVQVWRQEAAAIDPRRDPYTVHLVRGQSGVKPGGERPHTWPLAAWTKP